MKKILLALALLAATSAFATNQPQIIPTSDAKHAYSTDPQKESNIPLTPDMQIVSAFTQQTDEKLNYKLDVKFPRIVGKLSRGAKKFNATIEKLVDQEIIEFKKNIALDAVDLKNIPADLRHYSYHMDYDIDVIKPKNDRLISVRLSTEIMQAGRAHPYHRKQVVNFDLNKGQEISLNDLFKPHSHFLKTFATYSDKSLSEKLKKDNWMVAKGTAPRLKNFKNWNLQEDSILITFDEYQVAPYVYGAQEVEIPYSSLKKMLSTEAPIAPCVQDAKNCEVG